MFYFKIFCFLFLFNLIKGLNLLNDYSSYTIERFKTELENEDYLFVYFFSQNSKFFKESDEIFQNAIFAFNEEQLEREKNINEKIAKTKFGKINCDKKHGSKICKAFLVNSFPKFKLFRFGNYLVDFNFNQEMILLNWLRKYANSISIRFSSFLSLDKYLKSIKEPVIVGLFVNRYDRHTVDLWYNAVVRVKSHWNYKDLVFCHIFENYSKDSLKKFFLLKTVTSEKINLPAVILFRPNYLKKEKEKKIIFYDFSGKEDLEKWIKRKTFGVVIWRTRDNADDLKLPLIVAYFDVNFKTKPKFSVKWRNIMLDLAYKKPNINFAISNSYTFRKSLRNSNLPVPYDETDPVFIAYDIFGINYFFNETYSKTSLLQFILNFEKGFLVPLTKFNNKSKLNLDNNLNSTELTDLDFPKKLTINKNDVFIVFYAPWCKHCKDIFPLWDEIIKLFKNEPKLDLFKIDATQNKIPYKFEIQIYPTFYFIPSKSKKLILYKGNLMLHNFIQFVIKHASNPLKTLDENGLPLKYNTEFFFPTKEEL